MFINNTGGCKLLVSSKGNPASVKEKLFNIIKKLWHHFPYLFLFSIHAIIILQTTMST